MRTIRNCKVAVVGGAGFLGSHAVDHLIEDRGCEVVVIDNLVAGRREFVNERATFLHHDITGSEDYLLRAFAGVDYVFNYAAHPYVPDSFERPIHVCDVNFFGAMKVINAAQEAGCKGILQVSSAEVYGDWGSHYRDALQGVQAIDEGCPVSPHSSYGASKAAIDAWVQVRWREAQTPCIALRQFNCVGERETHPYVVPEIIGQLSKQVRLSSFRSMATRLRLGNNSFRDFLYAGDQARLAVELLEKGQWGEVYNLGSEDGIKIYDLAKIIGRLMGFADVVVEPDPARVRPWEIWMLLASNAKLYRTIDGRPQVTLEDALRRTIAWFEANGRRWPWER